MENQHDFIKHIFREEPSYLANPALETIILDATSTSEFKNTVCKERETIQPDIPSRSIIPLIEDFPEVYVHLAILLLFSALN